MKFKKKYFVFVQPAIRSMGSQSSATGNGPILNKVFSIDMIHEKVRNSEGFVQFCNRFLCSSLFTEYGC